MKKVLWLVMMLCLGLSAFAQDRNTTGSIGGSVKDANGAGIPNATVNVTGQTGTKTATSNDEGVFEVQGLIPGFYAVKIEQPGFKAAEAKQVEVFVGKQATLNLTLEPGLATEVVQVTDVAATDLSSTAVGQNLSDSLFDNIPVQRSVTSLFYLSPGASDSLGGGKDNPSIAGGSPLDNLYIADGVNITDSAFGGIGTFTRVYGSLGTGINTSFIKEVQVKTGGFEPQYGQAQGGIVNIITQSGGNEYHGALYGYARPKAFEATRRQRDTFSVNKVGELRHEENYDAGADFGGPIIPSIKDKLFFFGSFNPTVRREIVAGAAGSGLRTLLGEHARRFRTLNYAAKVDWNIAPSHALAFSIFGDPTKTNLTSHNNLNIDNTTAQSILEFGTRNTSLRYNGALTPTWTLSASFSQGKNHFDESGFADVFQITDLTQTGGLTGQRGSFVAQGLGFFEPTDSKTYRTTFDTTKNVTFLGSHTFGLGYQYQRATYGGRRDRSGPKSAVPATNAFGISTALLGGGAGAAIGQSTNNVFSLRLANAGCTQCPLMNIPGLGDRRVYLLNDRGEFGNTTFTTRSNYHAAYVQDTWRFNKYVTAVVGIRHEQERLIGSPDATGARSGYSFTGQWAPRIGVTVDPLGQGKTKVYYNFGRFFEYIPLDLAERSLSAESDFRNAEFIPEFTGTGTNKRVVINPLTRTVNPIVDAAHLVSCGSGAPGSPQQNCRDAGFYPSTVSTSVTSAVAILPGTKLGYSDENLIGFEQQFPRNFTLSLRYQDKRIKRIVEDAALVAPESADFFGQAYFIGNINGQLDAATNPISRRFTPGGTPPAACDEHLVNSDLGICYLTNGVNGQAAGNFVADGVADGFPNPVHIYKAFEIEVNKRFSNNWQLLSNYRIASLRGNYEGHFRNDNGQTDPAISSLFDFTEGEFALLGDQTAIGPLNTDRTHNFNLYPTYTFSKDGGIWRQLSGLTLGLGIHGESGVPINRFNAHPIYSNSGEIPIGGRGALGRTAWFVRGDIHADYKWNITETQKMSFIADFFNVTNNRRVRRPNEFAQLSGGIPNVDFRAPRAFYLPFNMRLGLRWEF